VSGQNTADTDRTPGYRVLGQPTLADTSLESRCPAANVRFGGMDTGGDKFGPSGIAVDMHGRLYVTDYGGQRVLTWPDIESLAACQAADGVIGVGELSGPEAVAVDPDSRTVFVADTLSHTVRGYRRDGTGAWTQTVRLGTEGASGSSLSDFQFPRGLALGGDGHLYVGRAHRGGADLARRLYDGGSLSVARQGRYLRGPRDLPSRHRRGTRTDSSGLHSPSIPLDLKQEGTPCLI